MTDLPFEASVTSICEVEIGSTAKPRRLLGTATVLNGGFFLTARHVIENIGPNVRNVGLPIWINNADCFFEPLGTLEFAPGRIDIAIGKTSLPTRSEFAFDKDHIVTIWQEVFALGYPETAVEPGLDKIATGLRAFKGIVQRNIRNDGFSPPQDHSDRIELDFTMGQGASGSPIFYTRGHSRMMLCGIYRGARRHEIVLETISESSVNGKIETHQTSKIEYFGEACMLRPIIDWKPAIGAGMSLAQILALSA